MGGQLQVTVWKPTITKINGGGLVEHRDVFAVEAPESGYVAEYNSTLHATNGMSPGVTLNKQFYFYFGQPRNYGRLHFRTDGDRPAVAVDYWLNPAPDSRNLECDPSKIVRSP